MTSTQDLGASAGRGAAVTFLAQLFRVGLQFVGIVVLARILTPNDYGLVAMVTAVIGVAEVFRDFGLSMAAVQSKALSKQQRNNLFWLNTLIGAILTVLVFFSAPLVASLFGRAELEPLTQALSVTFLLNGVSTQYRASLNRDMKFFKLNGSEIAGQALGLLIGIVAGIAGWGYWALAAQQVSQALAALVVLVIAARWLPGRYDRSVRTASFLSYGMNLLGVNLLSYASKNLSTVVIGASLGPAQLGQYNRAYQLLTLPLNQINAPATRVALPVLSRLQDSREDFDRFLVRGQSMLLHVVVFTFVLAVAMTPPLVELFLGDQWGDVVPIFRALAIAGIFQSAGYVTYWVFLAKGLTRENLYYSLVTRTLQIVLIVAAAPFGLMPIVWAYVVGVVVSWPLSLVYLRYLRAAPVGPLVSNVLAILAAYAVIGGVTYLTVVTVQVESSLLDVVIGLVVALATAALLCAVWPRYRRELRDLLRVFTKIRKKRS